MDTKFDYSDWRVLVVDDEPDNLDLISSLLEFKGATVEKAQNAERGLEALKSFEPTIILLDLAMPHIDGWELQKRLRGLPALDNVPIVALTALAMPGDAEKVMEAGFDGYVSKPFRIDGLLEELAECVARFANGKTNS